MAASDQNISRETFDHLVDLAEFKLEESESQYLLKEMNAQLGAIDRMEAITLDEELPLASRGVPYPPERKQVLRADKEQSFENPGKIIAQAPETRDGYIVVPDIPHTTLE